MRIDGKSVSSAPGPRQGGGARGAGPAFRPDMGQPAARPAPAMAPGAAAGIGALLALQTVEDPLAGRRRTVRRAHGLLDALEEIKLDLLAGHISPGRLDRAAHLLAEARSGADPDLEAVVGDIELRVAVELAKQGRFVGP